MGLIVAASFTVALLAYGYLAAREGNREEFYILILVATLGAMVLAASTHFVSFFLGLEILSVALYALISYLHGRPLPVEAGIKYLVLAAASAAFLLFGIALIYADLGTMEFARIAQILATKVDLNPTLLLPGVALIVTGIGFKLALVPFHMWTPDVYEGAPAPVTAFVATVSKGGMFALLLRYFHQSGAHSLCARVFSVLDHSRRFHVCRQSARAIAKQREAHPGLFFDRANGLPASGISNRRTHGHERRRLLSGGLLCDDPGRFRCRYGALRA